MKLTIITVCFNAIHELYKTHESLKTLEHCSIEWIVVDNLSSDGTPALAKCLLPPPSIYIYEPDRGIYDAMNKGIRQATGDFILFLNAGDRLHVDNWSTVKGYLSSAIHGETDAIMFDCNYVKNNRLVYKKKAKHLAKAVKHGMPASHQSIFFRSTTIKKFEHSLKYKICGDYELIAYLFNLQANCEVHNIVSSIFEVGGVSSKCILPLFTEPFLIQKEILALPLSTRLFSFLRRSLATSLYMIISRLR